jgi:hypothetical protein
MLNAPLFLRTNDNKQYICTCVASWNALFAILQAQRVLPEPAHVVCVSAVPLLAYHSMSS